MAVEYDGSCECYVGEPCTDSAGKIGEFNVELDGTCVCYPVDDSVNDIDDIIGSSDDELEDPILAAKCAGGSKGCTGRKKNGVWYCQTNLQDTDSSSTLKRCCRAYAGANCTWQ